MTLYINRWANFYFLSLFFFFLIFFINMTDKESLLLVSLLLQPFKLENTGKINFAYTIER